jgi:hypothetical protein
MRRGTLIQPPLPPRSTPCDSPKPQLWLLSGTGSNRDLDVLWPGFSPNSQDAPADSDYQRAAPFDQRLSVNVRQRPTVYESPSSTINATLDPCPDPDNFYFSRNRARQNGLQTQASSAFAAPASAGSTALLVMDMEGQVNSGMGRRMG